MPSTPSKGARSRWGTTRFELQTNYDRIQSVVNDSPNFTVAYDKLVKLNLLTVTYAAFVRTWKKVKAEMDKKATDNQPVDQTRPKQEPKTRKPLPKVSTGDINKFTLRTGDEGSKLW
ncbi:MAG: hypothetical protein K5905_00815 [Roseibium sp.]|uniref:hypothetical protein n=1 Tax=Roseibium sp. TaxID=1936156 RepID=UPI0026022D1E|nr:hypothetical protein [Roseibium sp.]MCV0423989.1 hypothetical protein [Roseibium sp.]